MSWATYSDALIGPNGSGKTTTMRMLADAAEPHLGRSLRRRLFDLHEAEGNSPSGRLYARRSFGVYDDMKVIEHLEFFAAAYRIKGPKRRKICDEVLDLVGLDYKRDEPATSLSKGMTQRLGLARVLLHDPQVLLLDEPASGPSTLCIRIEIRQAYQAPR